MWQLGTIFITIFLAELGDNAQIATLLLASEQKNTPVSVFFASASALAMCAAVSVLVGSCAGRWLEHVPLKLLAGVGFILIGGWTVVQHFRGV
ncbi:MAG TPA: TMEM165/GDT1 family protein [Rhizomicrobium sp.]|jgi:putative Ca2+/H+ antiporter (TMEM165/GDT1 family)|nr:TMEM165/GDT1 family protein [Rhizomicrobium sp.]